MGPGDANWRFLHTLYQSHFSAHTHGCLYIYPSRNAMLTKAFYSRHRTSRFFVCLSTSSCVFSVASSSVLPTPLSVPEL